MSRSRALLLFSTVGVLLVAGGCKKDDSTPPAALNPCGQRNSSHYGKGQLSWYPSGSGDTVAISGSYIPSAQFLSDTADAQGAGGFIRDTVVSSKPLRGMMVGFNHIPKKDFLIEQILIIQFYNRSGPLRTGQIPFLSSTDTLAGVYANATLFYADSLHPPYTIYDATSGNLMLTTFDSCSQRFEANFDLSMWDPTDTTTRIHLTNGEMNIRFVDSYFSY